MTVLRLVVALFTLSLLAVRPSVGSAQEPPAAIIGRPLTLEMAQLSCPECACLRARHDVLMLRREYREVHRKVSTRTPRLIMTAGLAGAGGVLLGSLLATVFVPLVQQDPTAMGAERHEEQLRFQRFHRRVMFTGGLLSLGALGVGLFGAHRHAERKRDGAPYRERDTQLRRELKEARQSERAQCRDVR